MAKSLKAKDGRTVSDGGKVKLTLQHGDAERVVRGTVHAFEPNTAQIAELKAQLKALQADNRTRWEVETDDPAQPAVGFLPEHVLSAKDM